MQLSRNPNSPLSAIGTSAFRNETFISSSQGDKNACSTPSSLLESNYCSDNSKQGFCDSKRDNGKKKDEPLVLEAVMVSF